LGIVYKILQGFHLLIDVKKTFNFIVFAQKHPNPNLKDQIKNQPQTELY